MAGHGPPPKNPSQRARRNKDPQPLRVLIEEPATQPSLPDVQPDGEPWPTPTVAWWRMWRESALSSEFTSSDWSYLLDTAILHAQLWTGKATVAAELRLRVAQFGATPADRARLRIAFAQANEADERQGTRTSSSRSRHAGLRLAE